MKIFKKMKKGFTLVELVVVIAVIAILSAVSVGAYFGITDSANSSRLEQEAKQVHTAIQAVALAPNDHSSLSKTGLTIARAGDFEAALEENLGIDVALTDVQDTKDLKKPTIYFVDPSIAPVLGGTTVYSSFEYFSHEIGGKRAVADVVTGEVDVVNKTDDSTNIKPSPISISLAEANEIGEAQENDKYTEQEYILEGHISSISNTTYGNMTITNGDTSFFLFGLYEGEVRYDEMVEKPSVGDFVKVFGVIGNHNAIAQMKNAQLLEHEKVEQEELEPITLSISDAIDICLGFNPGENSGLQEYIVEGEITEIKNYTYGNVIITDGEFELLIYGLSDENGEIYQNFEVKPNEGDIIEVRGLLGNYNGTAQLSEGVLTDFTENSPIVTPEENTVIFELNDKNNRTTFNVDQQIWEKDGIKVTNNKSASSSNIADYCPPRFYKDSDFIIEYTKNIESLEIKFDSTFDKDTNPFKYDGNLIGISNESYTITAEEDVMLIVLNNPCVEFKYEKLAEQFRPINIKIHYNNETPVEPAPVVPTLESISANKSEVYFDTLEASEVISITAHYDDSSTADVLASDVDWTSNNPSVATVVDGVITSVANGNATITATYNEKTTTIDVVVNYEAPVVETTITIYFENNWQWPDAAIYYWGSSTHENPSSMPGITFTSEDIVGQNDQGYDIYSFELPIDVTGFLFNGTGQYGAEQSTDITSGWVEGICYYMTYDSNTNTKPCGTYNYNPGAGEEENKTALIEFGTRESDNTTAFANSDDVLAFITEGKEYITGAANISYAYAGKTGIKFSSSKQNGSITLNLSSDIKNVKSITLTALRWKSTEAATIKIGDCAAQDLTENEATYDFDVTGNVTSITISVTKRAYLTSIIINY